MRQVLLTSFDVATMVGGAGGSTAWYNTPGFEVWKYFNLLLFIGILFFILKKPIVTSFHSRRESIRNDLRRAQEERDNALAKLEEVNTRLANLDNQIKAVKDHARKEAEEERERLSRATDEEMQRLREQAQREIESAVKYAKQELQREAAEQSVRLAEEMIRRDLRPEDESHFLEGYTQKLQGVRR